MGAPPFSFLAGRYRLGEPLGAGGSGSVWRAEDTVSGKAVAAKLLSCTTTGARIRMRREILALRVLEVPGVVRLLDHGSQDDVPFLVMELVEGTPFPGDGWDGRWASLAPTVLRVLEALARVHAAGVLHRDLKPANLLVDAEGRPTILDLGLARGETLGATITVHDAVLGTPGWQAPEQMSGGVVDARADLYAIGVMLFEALAGRPPHDGDHPQQLFFARVMRDAPSLADVAPEVPAAVARIVDRLLARQPESRPRSALEVLAELRGGPAAVAARLPRLGDPGLVDRVEAALRAGGPVDVVGPHGAGRTRLVEEAVARLVAEGRPVVRLSPSGRPFGSMRELAPDTADGTDRGRVLERTLDEALSRGTVIVADDADRLDRWSAALLRRCRQRGAVIRVTQEGGPDAIEVGPLSEEDLRPLVAGPSRFFHLPEDGARLLFERTGGLAARVVAETEAWVGAGLARWEGEQLVVERSALDRLATGLRPDLYLPAISGEPLVAPLEELLAWVSLAWPHATPERLGGLTGLAGWELDVELEELVRLGHLRVVAGHFVPLRPALALEAWGEERRREAHAALAAALPSGAEGRLEHLVAAGDLAGAAGEAEARGRQLSTGGYNGKAIATFLQGIAAARDAGDVEAEQSLLRAAASLALSDGSASSREQVLYELGRATALHGDCVALADLVRTQLLREAGRGDASLELARALPPFADEELECWRRAAHLAPLLARAAWAEAEAVVADALAWADAHGTPLPRGRAWSWKGLLHYYRDEPDEAVAAHLVALPLRTTVTDRLTSFGNLLLALANAGRHREGLRFAEEGVALARLCRIPNLEAKLQFQLRLNAVYLGDPPRPDLDLVEAAAHIGNANLLASVAWTEAAAAWEQGEHALAGEIAARFLSSHTLPDGYVQARAMACAGAGRADPDEARAIVDLAASPRVTPDAVLISLGLVSTVTPVAEPGWLALADAAWARIRHRRRSQVPTFLDAATAYSRILEAWRPDV